MTIPIFLLGGPRREAGGGGGGGFDDPFWENVVAVANLVPATDYSNNANPGKFMGTAGVTPIKSLFSTPMLCLGNVGNTQRVPALLCDPVGFELGASEFCLELWMEGNGSPSDIPLVTRWDLGSVNRSWQIKYSQSQNRVQFSYSTDGTDEVGDAAFDFDTDGVASLFDQEPHHIAVERSGNTCTVYVDGIAGSVTLDMTGATIYTPASSELNCFVGGSGTKTGGLYYPVSYATGFFHSVRHTIGNTRYEGAFTRPSAAFPKNGSGDAKFSDVALLLDFEGTTGTHVLGNTAPRPYSLGDQEIPKIDLDGFKTGSGPLWFPTCRDYNIQVDFTIEVFSFAMTNTSAGTVVGQWYPAPDECSWVLRQTGSGGLRFTISNDGDDTNVENFDFSTTFTLSTAYDVAIERNGSTITLFVDGAVDSTHTLTGATYNTNNGNKTPLAFGAQVNHSTSRTDTSNDFTMKAFRWTSAARFEGSAYTPEGLPLPTYFDLSAYYDLTNAVKLDATDLPRFSTIDGNAISVINLIGDSNDGQQFCYSEKAMTGSFPIYWEVEIHGADNTDSNGYVSVVEAAGLVNNDTEFPSDTSNAAAYRGLGEIRGAAGITGSLLPFGGGDVVMMLFKPSTTELWCGVNGVWNDDPLDPATYTIGGGTTFYPALHHRMETDRQTLLSTDEMFYYTKPAGSASLAEFGVGSYYTVTVPAGTVSSDLTNFPLLITLDQMPDSFWDGVSSSGGNIRAEELDGTLIPIDVVQIDSVTKTGHLFMKVPSILAASDNDWIIRTKPGLSAPDPAASDGRNAVWSAYEAVYHLSDGTDATGNGQDVSLDALNSPAYKETTGTLGNYLDTALDGGGTSGGSFDWTSSEILSFSTYARVDNTPPSDFTQAYIFSLSDGIESVGAVISPSLNLDMFSTGADTTGETSSEAITTGQDVHLAGEYDQGSDTLKTFIDGATDINATGYTDNAPLTSASIHIGTSENGDEATTGRFYEFRIGKFAFPTGWLSAEVDNITSPGTFFNVTAPYEASEADGFWQFYGTDGATTYIYQGNESIGGSSWNSAVLSDTQTLYGPTSLYLTGGAFLDINVDDAQFSLVDASGSTTIDAWVYLDVADPTSGGPWTIINKRPPSSADEYTVSVTSSGLLQVAVFENGAGEQVLEDPDVFPAQQWVHVAACRSGTTGWELFINGVSKDTGTQTFSVSPAGSAVDLHIGRSGFTSGREWEGYIDSIRWTPRVLYVTDFTPGELSF